MVPVGEDLGRVLRVCSSQGLRYKFCRMLIILVLNDYDFFSCRALSSASEAWELSSLAHKVASIYEHLKNQLALCYQYIGENIIENISIT